MTAQTPTTCIMKIYNATLSVGPLPKPKASTKAIASSQDYKRGSSKQRCTSDQSCLFWTCFRSRVGLRLNGRFSQKALISYFQIPTQELLRMPPKEYHSIRGVKREVQDLIILEACLIMRTNGRIETPGSPM